MKFEADEQLDIQSLRSDMINYFSTAINPFDVDLVGVEEIENLSKEKLIEIAKGNGFNINYYIIEDDDLKE